MEQIVSVVMAVLIGLTIIVFGIVMMALNYAKQEARKYENDR